jgi:hypothetical protein
MLLNEDRASTGSFWHGVTTCDRRVLDTGPALLQAYAAVARAHQDQHELRYTIARRLTARQTLTSRRLTAIAIPRRATARRRAQILHRQFERTWSLHHSVQLQQCTTLQRASVRSNRLSIEEG